MLSSDNHSMWLENGVTISQKDVAMVEKLSRVGKSDANGNWLQCFEEQSVQFVVLNQSQDEKLIKTLRRQPEWSVWFEGDGAVIFTRCAQNRRR